MRPKFWSVSLYDQWFPRYHTFYNSALTTMLNDQKKKTEQKCQKFKISYFSILWTTLIETLPRRIHEFLGTNLVCSFRGDVVWNFYSHVGPMLAKTKNICQKSKISNFTILATNLEQLVETLLRSMLDFFRVNLLRTFRGDVVWNFFSHMVLC